MSGEVIEAEAVEVGTDLEAVSAPPPSLFRTNDPVEVLTEAKRVADALAPVIRSAGLVANVSGKDYLTVEAWQTLGQQVGVTAVVVSTTRIDKGWEARAEARALDGRVLGAADSMCLKDEQRWKDSEDFEIRSMAQTRAMSRALASVLRFIPTLAGMGGTPAEEMTNVSRGSGGSSSGPRKPSPKQRDLFEKLVKEAGSTGEGLAIVMAWADEKLSGGKGGSMSTAIDGLIDKGKRTETCDRLEEAAREWNEGKSSETPEYDAEQVGDGSDLPFDTEGISF